MTRHALPLTPSLSPNGGEGERSAKANVNLRRSRRGGNLVTCNATVGENEQSCAHDRPLTPSLSPGGGEGVRVTCSKVRYRHSRAGGNLVIPMTQARKNTLQHPYLPAPLVPSPPLGERVRVRGIPSRTSQQRGAALFYVMGIMTVVIMIAAGVWQSMHVQQAETRRASRQAVVRQLAEAGLDHARAAHASRRPLPLGREYPLGEGYYMVRKQVREDGATRMISLGLLRDGDVVTASQELSEVWHVE